MIRTIVTAIAASALVLLGAGAATADPISERCARATIPTALCDGHGGVIPGGTLSGGNDSAGVGNVRQVGPTKYLSDYKYPEQIMNADGTPKLGANGEPLYTLGSPVYSTKPGTEAGKTDSDGNLVRDLSGYQYK